MNGDFELEVGADEQSGALSVRVLHSVAGGLPGSRAVLDADGLLARHAQLESSVLASAVPRRRVAPEDEQPLLETGRELFDAVFTGAVKDAYRASLGAVQQGGKRLRVVLHLTSPGLAALPWESMYDPQIGEYLCRAEPLIRHVDAPFTPSPLQVRPPLRILGLVSSPARLAPLDVQDEQHGLEEALAGPLAAGRVELTWTPDARWLTIQDLLLEDTWHILHFIGHGDFDPASDEGVLALAGPGGRADLVEASRLAALLSVAEHAPQLVVLNSCSSGREGARDLFSGTAAALVHGGISAAAAMQFSISDDAARRFARGFYAAIARGRPVDEAVRNGRIAILAAARTLEWVTPVLYVRGGITQLFDLTGPPLPRPREPEPPAAGPPPPQTPPEPGASPATLDAIYVRARGELRVQHYDTAIESLRELLTLDPSHPEASELLERAEHGRQLAQAYARGKAAEDNSDWPTAIRKYDTVLRADPGYQDTTQRREHCRKQQQISDLQAELSYHYDTENWQAVLDTDTELTALDPTSADPDSFTTRAREHLHQTELEDSYNKARASEEAHDWAAATAAYAQIINTNWDYQDAAARHERCAKHICYVPEPRTIRLGSCDCLAISPDGTRLAVAIGHLVRVWNLHDDQMAWQTKISGWNNMVESIAFSPDGARLAAGNFDKTARVWDAVTGTEQFRVTHRKAVFGVAFSPDGARLATASEDGTARVWDAVTGTEQFRVTHRSTVFGVAFSPDGARLATASGDKTARVWDAVTGTEQFRVTHQDLLHWVAFSPDGTRLATASWDGTARVWDAVTGTEQLRITHRKAVTCVAFSPDGTRLATASWDHTVRITDVGGNSG